MSDSVVAEAATSRAAESVLTSDLAAEEVRALAAESANDGKIEVEKARVTAILALSVAELNTFREIELAYKAADTDVENTVTNLVNARVLIATPVMTGQCQAQGGVQTTDLVGNDELLLRSIANANVRIEPSGNGTVEVSKALNCAAAVSSTAFSQAGQAVLDQSSSVENLSDVTSKGSGAIITTSERTRVGWVDVTSSVQDLVNDRQTTGVADGKYRLKTDSLSKTDAETESVFNSAIGARQTTAAQEAAYRKIADSYSQSQVYTQSAADAEFYDRSTLDTEFGTKQDSLDANGALVVAAHPYVTADKDKVAANHLKRSYTLAEQAKVGVNDLKRSYLLTEEAKVTANGASIVTHTADIAANVTSLGQKYATSVAEAKHLAQAILIDANTDKISYSAVEQAKVTANGLKTSYDTVASALAATHTANIAANVVTLAGKISSTGAQTFTGDIQITGSGAGGGLTIATGNLYMDASKTITFGTSKLHLGHDGDDAVLESDTGDFLIRNYKNATSGDFKVQTRSGGNTYHNDAFKVSYDGNCSTAGSMTAANLVVSAGQINFANLPNSPANLSTGDLWRNGTAVNIVV